ncbi:Pentatricopeptide repeat-containing protein [Capsicum annuum]|nr:Pentatricopeptide repeat-containing protein [Capsicum annuum]
MFSSRSLSSPFTQNLLIDQVMAAIIRNRPFETNVVVSIPQPVWTVEAVSQVLRSIPRFLFQSPRSMGRQKGFRHRTPLKQRNIKEEFHKARRGVLVLGPAAHRDPRNVQLGLEKALEFFHWVENHCGFTHSELTCREMSLVLAKGSSKPKLLWEFLKRMSRRGLLTTPTITCLIKVLGEEGLVNEALATFYRMKQFHLQPDVYAYNTLIFALCRVGNFKKAKFLMEQMELPGLLETLISLTAMWWGRALDPVHSGSFSASGCPFTAMWTLTVKCQYTSALPENALVGLMVFDSMVRVYDLGFGECCRVVMFHGNVSFLPSRYIVVNLLISEQVKFRGPYSWNCDGQNKQLSAPQVVGQ